MEKIKKIEAGDILLMKKAHPCGSYNMEVLRIGSDLRLKCCGCGRDFTVERIKIEKNIKSVLKKGTEE